MTALQRAKARITELETALNNAVADSTEHARAAQAAKDELEAARKPVDVVVTNRPQPTFPNNPTWEQKARAAWDEVKRLETERQANAKQIHDFNIRLGINDTNERRIEDAEALIRSNEQVARETRDRVAASFATEIAERNKRLGEMEEKLAQAEVRIEELESAGTDAGTGVYIEDEVEALTDVIRAAKAIRKRWRECITA